MMPYRLFLATSTLALFLLTPCAAETLIISEIVDGTLPGGQPKFVELTNTGMSSVDLSAFSIGNFNNGSTDLGGGASTVLAGSLAAGDSFVIAYEGEPDMGTSVFEDTYGFAPDLFIGPFINGDDVVALFDGPATGDGSDASIVDVYGVIGVDGTDEVWEYTDGFSVRMPTVVAPSSTFMESEWTFGGVDSLQGADESESLTLLRERTTPGTHQFVPEPSSAFLALLSMLGLLVGFRRSK